MDGPRKDPKTGELVGPEDEQQNWLCGHCNVWCSMSETEADAEDEDEEDEYSEIREPHSLKGLTGKEVDELDEADANIIFVRAPTARQQQMINNVNIDRKQSDRGTMTGVAKSLMP